jgi:hypothetical protein
MQLQEGLRVADLWLEPRRMTCPTRTQLIARLSVMPQSVNADLKDVPFVNDLARTPEDRQAIEFLYAGQGIGRPFVAPPDMPADRAKMVRDAFMATMKDADFLADAKKQKLDVAPEDGEHLAALVKRIYATPKPIVDKIGELTK